MNTTELHRLFFKIETLGFIPEDVSTEEIMVYIKDSNTRMTKNMFRCLLYRISKEQPEEFRRLSKIAFNLRSRNATDVITEALSFSFFSDYLTKHSEELTKITANESLQKISE